MPWNTSHLLSQDWCVRKDHKDWASSCTHAAPPSAHTWNLCSSLSWNLLYMLLQKETSKHKYKSICGMLLTPPTHISRHKQTAGAAQAGLLWEGSRALPHLSRPQMGLQPLYTNPNYLVSFFLFVCFLQSIIPFKANSGFSCCQEQGFIASAWLPLGHMGRRDKLSLSVSADHR